MNVSPISSNNSYTSFQGRVIPVGFRWPKRMICALKKSKSLQKLADEKNINIFCYLKTKKGFVEPLYKPFFSFNECKITPKSLWKGFLNFFGIGIKKIPISIHSHTEKTVISMFDDSERIEVLKKDIENLQNFFNK